MLFFQQFCSGIYLTHRNLAANSEIEFKYSQFVKVLLFFRENSGFVVFEIGCCIISGEQNNWQSLSSHS